LAAAFMNQQSWQTLLLPPGDEDCIWELFHENSKVGRYSRAPSREEVKARVDELHESLPFYGYPEVSLPTDLIPLTQTLDSVLISRVSERELQPFPLSPRTVATILHYAYGVTRKNNGTHFPRPFRVVPSGGALYPLEIFFYSNQIDGWPCGLYHYSPSSHAVHLLYEGPLAQRISDALVQPTIALGASMVLFVTAIFERSIFKYGDRGYRFILIEAGHVAQNINLVTASLELGSVNIGGFYDRQIDDLLGLDGITHSTIYMVALGTERKIISHSSS